MKYFTPLINATAFPSLPTRGAWIEIDQPVRLHDLPQPSLPTRGAWIEISLTTTSDSRRPVRRSPHGERGLKYAACRWKSGRKLSLPTRGAWIEIRISHRQAAAPASLPTRGAWIEISLMASYLIFQLSSLPTRGAWIEISVLFSRVSRPEVAPHTGSVD